MRSQIVRVAVSNEANCLKNMILQLFVTEKHDQKKILANPAVGQITVITNSTDKHVVFIKSPHTCCLQRAAWTCF